SLLSEAALMWVHELLEMFDHAFRQVADNRPVGTIMYDFIEKADYIDTLLDQDERGSKGGGHGEWQVQNVSSYFDTLARFERDNEDHRVVHYMQYLDYALEIGENPQLNMDQVAEFDGVSISTIHSAKGREFPVVFLVNLVSDRFPSRNRHEVLPIPGGLIKEHLPEGDPHLQEERRLCYVGMTRAKDILYLTSADYYSQGIRKKKQSVFLYETGLVVEPEPVVGRETTDTRSGKKDLARAVFRSDDVEISPEIGASFLSGLKRQLSFSHLSSYSNCPYQFYFKYVLKIPGAASASRSFGMTMHNTLRQFYEMLMRSKQGFEGFETAPELTDLLAIYDRKWQADGYENEEQERKRYESGKKALELYFRTFYSDQQNPILLEGRFKVAVGPVLLNGAVDRVDEIDGGLEIIDYKTGKAPAKGEKGDDDVQLKLYALAVGDMFKKPVKSAKFLYVEAGIAKDVDITAEVKERVIDDVTEKWARIQDMLFLPQPGPLCKFCDYRGICDYAQV
ncbi:MAG: PD-(D/E)XK nuclease family protein, partial [Candidatus Dojkabacteria bacterium]|nr:PD-(D/E)XK nuclease family protein [Candidatus Dojkabacteria bacterium]